MKNNVFSLLLGALFSAAPLMANAQTFTPPPIPVCPAVPRAGAVQCDLQKRAIAACTATTKNAAEFGACMDAFMARTPFNCTLTTPADRPNCDRANAAKFR